jgi:hypothetical protein
MDNDVLHIERDKLIQSIFEIKDVDVIKKLRLLVTKSVSRPAVMTVDELKAEVMAAVKQIEKGEVISHEELFAEFGL